MNPMLMLQSRLTPLLKPIGATVMVTTLKDDIRISIDLPDRTINFVIEGWKAAHIYEDPSEFLLEVERMTYGPPRQ